MTVKDAENISFCPYCGSDAGFYTKDYVRGMTRYFYRFDGSEADNSSLYDMLYHTKGAYAYCANCDKRLFRMKSKGGIEMPEVNIYHPCITRISYRQEKGRF